MMLKWLRYSNDTSVNQMIIKKYCVSFSLKVIVVIVVVWMCRDLYRNLIKFLLLKIDLDKSVIRVTVNVIRVTVNVIRVTARLYCLKLLTYL